MNVRIPNILRRTLKRIVFHGSARYCPVCGASVRLFHPHGLTLRPDACCPVCNSLERHRFALTFLQRATNLFDGRPKRMLHFAPEAAFERRFRRLRGLDYLTADLEDPRAMVKVDITDIPYDDASFDVVYCSHVLEHVADDRRALRELYRILRPGGWMVVLVPITAARTFEDPSVRDPAERRRLFGQPDHVRVYGPDFAQRAAEPGFNVREVTAAALLGDAEAIRRGVRHEQLFFCRKPQTTAHGASPSAATHHHHPLGRAA